jgi:hypothetical protein
MKKLLTLVAVVAIAGSFTSCKKKYDCDCITTMGTTEVREAKGKSAQEACDDSEEKLLGISLETCTPVV